MNKYNQNYQIMIEQSQLISNYAKLLNFTKTVKTLGRNDNFNMSNYAHSDPIKISENMKAIQA